MERPLEFAHVLVDCMQAARLCIWLHSYISKEQENSFQECSLLNSTLILRPLPRLKQSTYGIMLYAGLEQAINSSSRPLLTQFKNAMCSLTCQTSVFTHSIPATSPLAAKAEIPETLAQGVLEGAPVPRLTGARDPPVAATSSCAL